MLSARSKGSVKREACQHKKTLIADACLKFAVARRPEPAADLVARTLNPGSPRPTYMRCVARLLFRPASAVRLEVFMRALTALAAVTVLSLSAGGSTAQERQGRYVAQERQGRYVMSPAEGGGFARLDTETGAMALCARKDGKWACDAMEDESRRMREQIDRLNAENLGLKAEVDRLDKLAGSDGSRSGALERHGQQLQLPTEQDVDKALDYVERIYRKFRDRLKDLDNQERKGTPL